MNTRIQSILTKTFHPVYLNVEDESHQHAGHNEAATGGGTHFSVVIVSDEFKGMPLVKRHRAVYQALTKELTQDGLHALALKTYTAQEFAEMAA